MEHDMETKSIEGLEGTITSIKVLDSLYNEGTVHFSQISIRY